MTLADLVTRAETLLPELAGAHEKWRGKAQRINSDTATLIRDLLTYATTVSQERDGWKFQLDGLEQIRLREHEYLIARAEQAEQERDAAIASAKAAAAQVEDLTARLDWVTKD